MTGWVVLAVLAPAHATEIGSPRPFGLGLQLGAPWGLTGKVYLGGRVNALDFLVGGWYDDFDAYYGDFYAQVSYHWHVTEITSGGGVAIPFRIGVGGFVGDRGVGFDDLGIGARVPFGLDFDLEMAPVQFYVEIALQLEVLPDLDMDPAGGIGVRYYF